MSPTFDPDRNIKILRVFFFFGGGGASSSENHFCVLTFALSSLSAFVGVLSLFSSRLAWPRNYSKLEALLVVHTARRGSQTTDLNLGSYWFQIAKA